jgi:putative CocE/NonD family hydrolase
MAQLAAAIEKPPHLKAIFPVATTDDLYDVVWHHGLFNGSFISAWLPAVGVMAQKTDAFWEGKRLDVVRHILAVPSVHRRMEHLNGEAIVNVLRNVIHAHYAEEPFGRLWQQVAVEHPTHDEFWEERNTRPELGSVTIPVYLGCDWENAPVHLPSTFTSWAALSGNDRVRMTLLPPGGLSWPWESLHYEALAWYDHWLKGADTGIMDGPPVRYVVPGTRRDGSDGSTDWRESDAWPPASTAKPLALSADGTLCSEPVTGDRSFLYFPEDAGRPKNANPPEAPDRLEWRTEPLTEPLEFAGEISLTLTARVSASDTAWIAVLYDEEPDGSRETITAGWLRASHRGGDSERQLIEPNAQHTYEIPMVPNARHLRTGHRLCLVVTSSDTGKDAPTILGFTHTPTGDSSLNVIYSSSQLVLPVISSGT